MKVSIIEAIVPTVSTSVLQRPRQTARVLHLLVTVRHGIVTARAFPFGHVTVATFLTWGPIELVITGGTGRREH